ncbi:DNA-processing protein DprA [Bifidobacterium sp.]|uniref:DNA-processing protein DprA n=1 Tax=Bifidobacterium sp. TaxID=41200 RepID=UPI0039E8F44A
MTANPSNDLELQPGSVQEGTMARALLSHCCDGPDPVMHTLLTNGMDVVMLWRLFADCDGLPTEDPGQERAVPEELRAAFIRGIEMGHRSVTEQSLKRLHAALARWSIRRRLLGFDSTTDLRSDKAQDWATAQHSMWVISPESRFWPRRLHDLPHTVGWSSPLCLWGQGSVSAMTRCDCPVAVVGSRQSNDYGRHLATQAGRTLAALGHTVISGGALGADACAHWGVIGNSQTPRLPDDMSGSAIAVFAGGLRRIGPSSNMRLFERIMQCRGALVSELSPDSIPEARRFLLRNRIIAAMSCRIIVTQARLRSGAINTATWGANLLREVYAIPGDIDHSDSAGCNALIRDAKASILTSFEDLADVCSPGHHPPQEVSETDVRRPDVTAISDNTCTPDNTAIPNDAATTDSSPEIQAHEARTPSEPVGGDASVNRLVRLNAKQKRAMEFIRECHATSKAATADALLHRFNADGLTRTVPSEEISRILGSLEILGLIHQDVSGNLMTKDP